MMEKVHQRPLWRSSDGDGIIDLHPSRDTNGNNRPQTIEWEVS